MSWAGLTALERKQAEIKTLVSEITGLKARIDEKVERINELLKEMEEISILDANNKLATQPLKKDK